MAEGFARRLAGELGVPVEASSDGIVGWDGSPAVDESIEAASERGADISGHRARRLEESHVREADLVVCMAGEHRESIGRMVPEASSRTFTLKELVRLLEATESGETFEDRIRAADELRASGFEGSPFDEDVSDPIGMSLDMFRAVAWDIDEWVTRMMQGLFVTTAAQGAPE
jgi:protein-tyrosine-phosphatase